MTLLIAGFATAPVAGAEPVSFAEQVRPLLSGKCFQCHGNDAASRKAGLRLDVADPGPESPKVIEPGDPAASELLKRITAADPEDRMPPPAHGEALTPDEIDVIRAWIAEGAPRTAHWAFTTPDRPLVPEAADPGWPRNPIDHFVLARLEREDLAPAPEADRLTLLRRLSLDLTGLPPTLAQIERVQNDTSDAWYEALVDRLLASPHYGEHWARHWLDAAQYADSDGFEKDKPRQVWSWRDWVIDAFNEDKPYNAFLIEQIAGDLLPDATPDQQVATGFLRNSMINEEGGADPEQFRMEAMFNRMDLVGRAMLGLTVACAQCHDHKYDPLTQAEYYQMMAFLNNSHERVMTVYSEEEQAQRETILGLIGDIETEIKEERPGWGEEMAAWAETAKAAPDPDWEVLDLTFDDTSAAGQKCLPQDDGSYLVQGYAPTRFAPKMTATTELGKITAIRLDLLTDPNLPRGGPGRSIYGGLALSEMEMRVTADDTPIAQYGEWTPVKIASAVATVNPPARELGVEFAGRDPESDETRVTGPIDMAIDGDNDTAWTTDIDPGRRNRDQYAIFTLEEPLVIEPGMTLAFRLGQHHGGWNSDDNQNNNIGRFRISVTDAEDTPSVALPPAVKTALAAETPDEDTLFRYWRTTAPDLARVNQRIDGLWQAHPIGTTQLVLEERETPRTTHLLARGDFLSPKEAVEPGVPAFLHPLAADGTPDRLDFARWVASKESPTTARAYINRVWQRIFGEGLVATTADFGLQGEAPSHPALLDWLATEFMDSGWRVKDLHRLIVTSAAYRQDARVTPELLARDPDNRLLARGARFRVEGETVRDIALAASGLLNDRVGGPSVNPPAPQFLFEPPASYGPKTWETDEGPAAYRRALYTFRFRSVPYPALQVFDSPTGEAPCTRRDRSNSPLQALTALNEPLFYESAIALARETLQSASGDDRDRIAHAFRRCTTRAPEPAEVDTLFAFLEDQRARIAAGALDPAAILSPIDIAPEARPADLAAWTLTARVLLNLDETIVRQ